MKSLFLLAVFAVCTISAIAQNNTIKPTAKVTPQAKAQFTKPVPIKSLRKMSLAPLRMNNVQRIVPTSGSASGTTISRNMTTRKTDRSNEKETVEDGRYCTSAIVSEANGDYEKIVLGNQNDKIYPGAIYLDRSVIDGSYTAPASLRLKPYQITTNMFSASSGGSSYVDVQPTMGDVYNGLAELMRRQSQVINPGGISIEVKEIFSSEQLGFFLQAGFQGYGVDLSAEFDYSKRKKQNIIFAKLKQVYFSVNLNRPSGASLVETASGLPSGLVYVNKVNYGRIGILKIESDSSIEAISAALDFTYGGNNMEVSAASRVNHQKVLGNSSITGFFFGGDATNIVPITSASGLSQFNDYVRSGLRLNPNVAPTAISYELKFLNDNATAAVNSTTTYTERQCVPAKGVKVVLNGISIEDIHGGDCSYAWGSVDVEVYELDERGRQTRRVMPVTEQLREQNVSKMWSILDPRNPQRGMINYKNIRSEQNVNMNTINKSWRYMLDPEKVAANQIAIVVKTNINTNHKDNDLAALGSHGMNRVETRTYRLNEVLVLPQEVATKAKYGSMIAGPYASHSRSDRVHHFRAHFTVVPD